MANISAQTDIQQQDAAARVMLRAGGLQRYLSELNSNIPHGVPKLLTDT